MPDKVIIPEFILVRVMHVASVMDTDPDPPFGMLLWKLMRDVAILQMQSEDCIIPEPDDGEIKLLGAPA